MKIIINVFKVSLYGYCLYLNDVVNNGFSKDKDYYIFLKILKVIDIFGMVNVYV